MECGSQRVFLDIVDIRSRLVECKWSECPDQARGEFGSRLACLQSGLKCPNLPDSPNMAGEEGWFGAI